MAKKSMVDKNEKRLVRIMARLVFRGDLSKKLKSGECEAEDVFKIMKVLDQTSGSSYIKYRNRCKMTGRPRGFRGCVGMSRGAFRDRVAFGLVNGFKKI